MADPLVAFIQMCTNTPDGLLAVTGKQNCLDLCETVRDYISDTRWELGKLDLHLFLRNALHRLTFYIHYSSRSWAHSPETRPGSTRNACVLNCTFGSPFSSFRLTYP